MRVGIVAKRNSPRAAYLADDLRSSLASAEVTVDLDEETAAALEGVSAAGLDAGGVPVESFADADLVVSVGGDGTFLYAARAAGSTPILGVNLGEVGFLNAVAPEDAEAAVTDAVERFRETGDVVARTVPRLRAEGDGWSLAPALNEVVVQGERRGRGGGMEYTVRVDGSLYAGGSADGVLVATPTGTSAYNLAEGGPLVHPDVAGLTVTEMVASDPMPSLVAPLSATVDVHVDDAHGPAVAVSDGRQRQPLEPPTRVRLVPAEEPVNIAGPEADFFEALGKLD